jgi:hypothetical protein
MPPDFRSGLLGLEQTRDAYGFVVKSGSTARRQPTSRERLGRWPYDPSGELRVSILRFTARAPALDLGKRCP